MANGRAAALDETEPLARAPWLAIAELTGTAGQSRIVSAAALTEQDVRFLAAKNITTGEQVRLDARGGVHAFMVETLGAITLSETPLPKPSAEAITVAQLNMVRDRGIACLPWTEELRGVQARVLFLHDRDARWPNITDATLTATLERWLTPYLAGKPRFDDFDSKEFCYSLMALLPDARELDTRAPAYFSTPAGTSHTIDYTAQGGPSVACRVQALYGLDTHPCVGDVPLALVLLSPAHRPLQTTKDLPAFWRGSWSAIKSEMRGRYPRHLWPDDPAQAIPTTRTKARL